LSYQVVSNLKNDANWTGDVQPICLNKSKMGESLSLIFCYCILNRWFCVISLRYSNLIRKVRKR
jgi:hypothetical protein